MKRMKLATLGLWPLAAVALCATVSQAALINVGDTFTLSRVPNQSALSAYQDFSGTIDGTSLDAKAGTFRLNVDNPIGGPTVDGTIYTYCTDVGINFQSGKTYKAVQFSDPVAHGVAPAWSAITESIENASWLYNTYYANPNDVSYTTDAAKAAGMQLAIWKVLYDTVDGTGIVNPTAWTTGNFQVTGGTAAGAGQGRDWATTLLNALNTARGNNTFTVYSDTWLHPVNNDSQGMIFTPVPEPTTIIAAAMLFLPFGASTVGFLRKNRKA